MRSTSNVPLWRNEKVLQWIGQLTFLLTIVLLFWFLFNNMFIGLQKQGITLGLSFLNGISSFDISESLVPYSRTSSYLNAFQVGLLNTIYVSVVGIIFSTLFGIVLGVARLSNNWLVNRLAALYLEIFRNLSLLVFLVFWYVGIFLKLPRVKEAITLPGHILLSNRGIGIPWLVPQAGWETYRWLLIFGLLCALGLGWLLHKRLPKSSTLAIFTASISSFILIGILGWVLQPSPPLQWDFPVVRGLHFSGGQIFTPEFMALTSGLILYTAAFIGEVVRAGILSVSKGQIEAAHALGLNQWQTLRLIIFPQALRVIIPPLTSQYLNLTKNSSLAIAIGYPDVFYVSNTIINQSGRAVEVISMVMAIYLSLSLLTSAFMNWYNQKNQLVER